MHRHYSGSLGHTQGLRPLQQQEGVRGNRPEPIVFPRCLRKHADTASPRTASIQTIRPVCARSLHPIHGRADRLTMTHLETAMQGARAHLDSTALNLLAERDRLEADHEGGVHTHLGTGPNNLCPLCQQNLRERTR